MNHWRSRLRAADAELTTRGPALDVQRVRHAVLAAAREGRAEAVAMWPRPFAAMVGVLAIVCVSAVSTVYRVHREVRDERVAATAAAGVDSASRTQLQFSTPGGTRIIWVFDPGFDTKGTLP